MFTLISHYEEHSRITSRCEYFTTAACQSSVLGSIAFLLLLQKWWYGCSLIFLFLGFFFFHFMWKYCFLAVNNIPWPTEIGQFPDFALSFINRHHVVRLTDCTWRILRDLRKMAPFIVFLSNWGWTSLFWQRIDGSVFARIPVSSLQ